jgi:hypothetical protein
MELSGLVKLTVLNIGANLEILAFKRSCVMRVTSFPSKVTDKRTEAPNCHTLLTLRGSSTNF